MIVVVSTADIQDRDGAILLFRSIKGVFSKLRVIWADGGYRGEVINKAKKHFKRRIEIVLRTDDNKGFKVVPKRWIVERTFGWLNNYRRLSKDYVRHPVNAEAFVYIAMIQTMLRRI